MRCDVVGVLGLVTVGVFGCGYGPRHAVGVVMGMGMGREGKGRA